jgi:hypothetical protein
MSKAEVTTEVPAKIVFELCDEYLISLEKAKEQTKKNYHHYYIKQTKFSLYKIKRVPEYSHEEALERADNSTHWQLNTGGQKYDVIKIKNLAFRDLSTTMQVNYEAWHMIHNRFTAVKPEGREHEEFEEF